MQILVICHTTNFKSLEFIDVVICQQIDKIAEKKEGLGKKTPHE